MRPHRIALALAIAAAPAGWALPALAQQHYEAVTTATIPPSQGTIPGPGARQTITSGQNGGPSFQVFGVPVRINAPVNAPYNAAATYHTFAGQPGNGENAVLAESIDGEP